MSWTDSVKNEEMVLHRGKERRNILRIKKKRKEKDLTGLVTSCIGTAF